MPPPPPSLELAPASIALERVTKRFPGGVTAVDTVDLRVAAGEFFSLLGPSGCGKTTTLRMIAGFEIPDEGTIRVGERDLTRIPVHRRDMGMVFQSYALLPHRTVAENVAFGLRMRKVPRAEITDRVRAALGQVKLAGYEDRRPSQLSGGQQQRVALARAIVIRPAVLLCDEPLGALDRKLRQAMQVELKELQRALGVTLVFVTHDQEEAVVLADRIALLFDGKLQMYDRPHAFYNRPADRRIAEFFGATNFIRGRSKNGTVETSLGRLRLARTAPPGDVTLTIRPESVRLGDGENSFPARVTHIAYLGTRINCSLDANGAALQVALPPHTKLHEGDKVTARLPPECLWALQG